MKMIPELDIELAELIREMRFGDAIAGFGAKPEYSFVAYRRQAGQIVSGSSFDFPLFTANQQESEKDNFLEEAKNTLALNIQSLALLTAKRDKKHYPGLHQAQERLRPVTVAFDHLASLDRPIFLGTLLPGPSEARTIHFGYGLLPGREEHDSSVYEAICDFILIAFLPYASYSKSDSSGAEEQPTEPEQKAGSRLFPNTKQIDRTEQFCIAQLVGNAVNIGVKHATLDRARNQYRENGRKTQFVSPSKTADYTLELDPDTLNIRSAQHFAEELIKIRDAKVMQTFFALWKFANDQDSYIFRNVPISELMKLVLEPPFNKKARQEFTKGVNYLAAISISVKVKAHETNRKGKKKPVLVENKGVHLLQVQAQYALRKEFNHLPEEDLTEDHYDQSVINKLSGELLPGNNRLFADRANVYSSRLLKLDANKDRQAIVLGFVLQTRFNQLADKERFVSMHRGYLIEQCEYQKSDQAKATTATKYLRTVLEKLQRIGIISGYENLTNNNADEVRMYPPEKAGQLT